MRYRPVPKTIVFARWLLLTLCLSLPALAQDAAQDAAPQQSAPRDPTRERIVLLHGMGEGPRTMSAIGEAFSPWGYQVSNERLNLERDTLHVIIDDLYKDLRRHMEDNVIHFVCYSQGCLVARGLIHRYRPPYLGRVVMLGPPNQGGEMIDYLRRRQVATFVTEGRYLPNLGTSNKYALAQLIGTDAEGYELGIIAGKEWTQNPSPITIPGSNRTIVGEERMKLAGMKEFISLPDVHHDDLYRDDAVRAMVVQFINTGSFVSHAP